MKTLDPLRDAQDVLPADYCMRCSGELYGTEAVPDEYGYTYCPNCREELAGYDSETVTAVLEAVDKEMGKYLSEDLRGIIWNRVVKQFPLKEAG